MTKHIPNLQVSKSISSTRGILSFVVVSIMIFAISCTTNPNPVNPDATDEVKEVLNYLYEISGEKVLTGQHNYQFEPLSSTEYVEDLIEKTPVVYGIELYDGTQYEKVIETAIDMHRKGCLITGMSHMPRPWETRSYHRSTWQELTDEQWQELITPGTEMYDLFIARIDTIAEPLKILRDEGIPVLWRPFHEMNGIWFWWGDKPGEDGIAKLWKIMYDRYTNHHNLNNLIWVWNANGPRDWEDDQAYDYHLYYPGHDYVDVLAADIYKGDFKQSHHDQLLELGEGRPIALGEVGKLPTPEIMRNQTQWTWFMCWARFVHTHNEPEDVKSLYEMPEMVTLDEFVK